MIFTSTSPDFGVTGVVDRFQQVRASVLVSVNGVRYNGKVYAHWDKLREVVSQLEKQEDGRVIPLTRVVVVECVKEVGMVFPAGSGDHWTSWDAFMKTGSTRAQDQTGPHMEYERVPFNHPLYILYSSGTTGKPKCIVHSTGGAMLQHMKEHLIHGDLTRNDVFFQYTTTGWMMFNWLVSALFAGCTVVLFDGSPFKPEPGVLWRLAEKYGVTRFGTSAKYIQSLQDMRVHPIDLGYDLSALKDIYSTGSPLTGDNYDFVYERVKSEVCLASITGGTDIVSLFAGHNHTVPVYRGEIQCRCLGMAVECWSDQASSSGGGGGGGDGGQSGRNVYGVSGDLVCTRAFPCMPIYFWNDTHPPNARYKEAYFSQYPGVWYHGDFVWLNPNTKGVVMLGRSDGTLKPAGVRFGSAELYNIVEKYHQGEVEDALAVGQRRPQDTDERVILFVKMVAGKEFSEELVVRIKGEIRKELSARHVPMFILETKEIPYTVNGKKVEVAVKKIVSGQRVEPSASLSNPDSLLFYTNLSQIQ